MKRLSVYLIGLTLVLLIGGRAFAHFGVILPSEEIVGQKDPKRVTFKICFMHPFEQEWLNMENQRPLV
jgi:cobalt/nickel transport protein